MTRIDNVLKSFKYITKSWWGIVIILFGGILLVWSISDLMLLSGDKIYSDYLAYNKPLTMNANMVDERFRVVIQSRSKKAKRKIKYKIIGPDGIPVIDGHDGYRKQTRAFYFSAGVPGKYILTIDDYYKPGGDDLPHRAAKYVNAKWVNVYQDDRTKLLGKLENFIVLW